MKKIEGAHGAQGISKSVVTIGNFDGVHLGHREIISRVVDIARKIDGQSVVMTFSPHPRKVLFPEKHMTQIFENIDQEIIFKEMGIDNLVVQPFSRALSQLTPEQFFIDYILKPLSPKALIVGYDFAFGANRQGSHKVLEDLSRANGITLEIIPPFKVDDFIVSSTEIRKVVGEGKVDLAHRFLGRPFYLNGIVEKGDQRGRTIGIPTANMSARGETFPLYGVYATKTLVRGKSYDSITNVGLVPTFKTSDHAPIKVESHIFNFNEDIYGEEIKVLFYDFIREEKKFSSLEELKKQIQNDIQVARGVLSRS